MKKTLKELLSKNVGRKQPVVFAFGRLNPPTQGHQKLIDRVITMAKRVKGLPVLYVSASQDKKKNPLKVKQKLDYLKKVYPRGIKLLPATNKERTFMEILKNNFDKKYTDVYMIAGSDRVAEFKRLISKYNGKDYNFDTVNVVSAGERDPDAEGVSGISASKMREFATKNDYKNFRSNLMTGTKEKDAMKLFKDLKNQMGVREDMLAPSDNEEQKIIRENYHNNEIFNLNEYVENLKDGTVGKIIKRGPNYVQYEMEDGGVKKAWLEDIVPSESLNTELTNEDVDKKKLVLQKNSNQLKSFKSFDEEIKEYDDEKKGLPFPGYDNAADAQKTLDIMRTKKKKENEKKDKKDKVFAIKTPGQPSIKDVDDWTQGPDNADQIHTMRTFNLKTPGQDRDYSKLVTTRKFQKFESVNEKKKDDDERKKETGQDPDIKDRPGTQPDVYYKGLKKSTKISRDRHFTKGAKMDDDNPKAYKPAPGDADAKTKPSKHTMAFKKKFGEDVEQEIKDIKSWSELDETIEQYKDEYGTDYRVKLDQTVSEMFDELLSENTGVKNKAAKSGMPYGILMKVYNRGMAAWRTGHRPGTTPQQWGMARVNSFVTKSSGTWGKADKDLAAKVRGK